MAITPQKFFSDNYGGRVEFLWHVAGMPWCCVTSTDIQAALGVAYKKTLFGNAYNSLPTPDEYYAIENMEYLNILERPSQQSWALSDSGGLSGGEFDITILCEDIGVTWDHRGSGLGTWGVDGVHTIISNQYDSTISVARLADDFVYGDAAMTITNDYGAALTTRINALAANKVLLLWVGNECVAASSIAGGVITIESRGVYRSREQSFFVDQENEGNNILVADAPLGGVIGKGSYLYAFLFDDAGTLLCEPVMMMKGKVSPTVETQAGVTKIHCNSWLSNLDCEIKFTPLKATFHGWQFSRAAESTNPTIPACQIPHIYILESKGNYQAAAGDGYKSIWLCDEGETIWYDNIYDLINLINAEFVASYAGASTHGSDQLTHLWWVDPSTWRLYCLGCFTYDDGVGQWERQELRAYISGPVPWMLGLGYKKIEVTRDAIQAVFDNFDYRRFTRFGYIFCPTIDTLYIDSTALGEPFYYPLDPNQYWEWRTPLHILEGEHEPYGINYLPNKGWWHSGQSKECAIYCHQYGWEFDAEGSPDNTLGWDFRFADDICRNFPIAVAPTASGGAASKRVIHLGPEYDYSDFEGATDFFVGIPDSKYGADKRPGYLKGVIDTANSGDNFIVVDDDYVFDSNPFHGVHTIPSLRSVDNKQGPVHVGSILCHIPLYHAPGMEWEIGAEIPGDPWPIFQAINATDTIRNLFRGLLGAQTGDYTLLPARARADHVPDIVNDGSGDFVETIDWDQLDEITRGVEDSTGLDIQWHLKFDSTFNFKKEFEQALLFLGVQPTWEWDATVTPPQHRMKFTRLGVANTSKALGEGRRITVDTRVSEPPSETFTGADGIINKFNVECNYSSTDSKYLKQISVKNQSGFAYLGGSPKDISIKTQLGYIAGLAGANSRAIARAVGVHFSNILCNLAWPQPEIEITVSFAQLLNLAVGRECLITDAYIQNPFTRELGLTDQVAKITRINYNWPQAEMALTLRLAFTPSYGWAPAMYIPAGTTVKDVGNTYVDVTLTATEDHYYSPAGSRRDMSWFGCLDWNPSINTYASRGCSCGAYKLLVFEIGVHNGASYDLTMGTGSYAITATKMNTPTYTFRMEGDVAGWDTAAAHVVTYADWDAGLEDCQKPFIYNADTGGTLDDGDEIIPGRIWK